MAMASGEESANVEPCDRAGQEQQGQLQKEDVRLAMGTDCRRVERAAP